MPVETESSNRPGDATASHVLVKTGPSLRQKKLRFSAISDYHKVCCYTHDTSLSAGGHSPTSKLPHDDAPTSILDSSSSANMYSLERWLLQGRKQSPWDSLRPHTDVLCDLWVSEGGIREVKEACKWSMIVGIDDECQDYWLSQRNEYT
jgi:hypothetical protein